MVFDEFEAKLLAFVQEVDLPNQSACLISLQAIDVL